MKRNIGFTAIIIVVIIICGIIVLRQVREITALQSRIEIMEQEKIELKEWHERRIEVETAYARLNRAFGISRYIEDLIVPFGAYTPLPEPNEDTGIDWFIYLRLRMYENGTGNVLPYEVVVDYFSQLRDPGYVLRLYNNGNHPEIEGFVNWMNSLTADEIGDFYSRINRIEGAYWRARYEEGITIPRLEDMTPEMLDALARKEADPDYELDLVSLMDD